MEDVESTPGDSPDPRRPRIFGIGLNKTATFSLSDALEMLGYRSLHHGGAEVHHAVRAAIDAGAPLLDNLDPAWDAFSDIGLLSRRFRMLDQQYPGSTFVLTVRPIEMWIDSRRRHIERNQALAEAGEYDGTFLVVDIPKWEREWHDHLERVHSYFDGRHDFLEIDITHNPSWEPICDLLGVPVPDVLFPWSNRDKVLHPGDVSEHAERSTSGG